MAGVLAAELGEAAGRPAPGKSAAKVLEETTASAERKLYSSYRPAHKRAILTLCGFISLITPFCDTIYLPSLPDVAVSLQTTAELTATSVSSYLFAVGVGQLLWGSISDRFGRSVVLYSALAVYEAITIGIIFVQSIDQLIVLRVLQGLFVGSTIVSAQAIASDVFEPSERGAAMGTVFLFLLIGPVIAPIVGGVLSEAFGWRATFITLAALTAPIALPSIAIIPETSFFLVLLRTRSGSKRGACVEPEALPLSADEAALDLRPALQMPHDALLLLLEAELLPYYIGTSVTFAAMFTSLTMLPLALAAEPYSLGASNIGFCYIPVGVLMLVGSMYGGPLSDHSSRVFALAPDGRMALPLAGFYICCAGSVAFGFCLGYRAPLAALLFSHALLGFGQALLMPSTMGYLSIVRQRKSAAACAVLTFLCFCLAGASVTVSVEASAAMGVEAFFLVLGLLCLLVGGLCTAAVASRLRAAHRSSYDEAV